MPAKTLRSLVDAADGQQSRDGFAWFRADAAELLMAAGASSGTLVVGAVGGAALLDAAWASSRAAVAGLTVVGSVPFAVAAWTAVLPVVMLLTATVIAAALVRAPSPGEPAVQGAADHSH